MEPEPGQDPERDSPDPDDAGDFGSWEDVENTLAAAAARAELLSGFAPGGAWDGRQPGPELAATLAAAAGPEFRCGLATGEEIVGVLRGMAALQSWAAAGLLGAARALIRDDAVPFPGRPRHGDLPDEWDDSLTHEVALALAVSVASADKTLRAAWELGARLPGTAALLQSGVLDLPRARLITEVFGDLSDDDAAKAEELLLPELTGPTRKTWTQIERLAAAIAAAVDPGLAERQRTSAERHLSRVTTFRERSGTAGLSGRDLPTAETLAAYANLDARALHYQDSGAFPGERIDRLRATAYLDLLNGVPAEERIASGHLSLDDTPEPDRPGPPEPDPGPDSRRGAGRSDCPCRECDGGCAYHDDDYPDDDEPNEDPPDSDPGPDDKPDGGWPDDDEPDGDPGPYGDDPDDDEPDDDEPDGDPGPYDDEPDDDERDGDPGPGDDKPAGGWPDDNEPVGGDSRGDRPTDDRATDDRATDDRATDDRATDETGEDEPGHDHRGRPGSDGRDGPEPAMTDLLLPLVTLLGLAERPGEGHGLGALDPSLCRGLAAIAVRSSRTILCVTVTDPDGIAIGHGCVTSGRLVRPPDGSTRPLIALPARINLTIPAAFLAALLAPSGSEPRKKMELPGSPRPPGAPAPPGTRGPAGWAFGPYCTVPVSGSTRVPGASVARRSDQPPGDPAWCGAWVLTLPSGQERTVTLGPVPTFDCDHRYESRAYKPNGTLRHLVQVRDYSCTFPTCNRHARESDFEHALPYDQGGRTCACNAGARSRRCHRVKQAPGWDVTQPKPGWHQWTTARGWTYAQGPKRYPA